MTGELAWGIFVVLMLFSVSVGSFLQKIYWLLMEWHREWREVNQMDEREELRHELNTL